jgi:hypothetical protein
MHVMNTQQACCVSSYVCASKLLYRFLMSAYHNLKGMSLILTVPHSEKQHATKKFHKATTVIPGIFDGYENLSVIKRGKRLKVFQNRMLKGYL